MPPLQGYTRQEGMLHHPDPHELQGTPEVPPERTDAERNTVSAAMTVYTSLRYWVISTIDYHEHCLITFFVSSSRLKILICGSF